MMDIAINPGNGYLVRERLGGGNWKQVFRAVYHHRLHDRALAVFIHPPSIAQLQKELEPLHKLLLNPSEHVAQYYGNFVGDDERLYIVEELLYRSLERLAPLTSGDRFLRIARDLCAGLAHLHGLGMVHRDLKLENCGIDHSDRAKLFDLGQVASEEGAAVGTILSRAPESIQREKHTKGSDVWALGAVLFALRTGDYPFVTRNENAKKRPPHGDERKQFDDMVKRRCLEATAQEKLRLKVNRAFPPGPAELMHRMLAFEPEKRPSAEQTRAEWDALLSLWLRPAEKLTAQPENLAQELKAYLEAVLRGTGMTPRQWVRYLSAVQRLEGKIGKSALEELHDLQAKVHSLRVKGQLK